MKILLLTILCFFVCFFGEAQTYPIKQGLGNANTNVQSAGTISSLNGFTWGFDYTDTTTANAALYVKFTPGIVIRTGTSFWVRNNTVNAWVALGGAGSLDADNGTVVQGGKVVLGGTALNIVSGTYIRNNYSPGTPSTLIQWSNRLTEDSIIDSGSGTTLNRVIGTTDPTYASSMFSLQRNFKESYHDTSNLQYGGVIAIFDRRQYDSTGSSFGTLASGKPMVWNDKGVEVTNQMFPPKDTADVYTDQDGRSSASFSSLWGLGAAWGYNIHVISSPYPDYSLASYNSVLDFQRVASRTRYRSLTGFGVASYLASYKTWEAPMDTTTASLGNYLSKTIGFYSYGNTDINLTGLGATKAQILVRSKTDTSIGFLSAPQYRNTNDVYTGIGFASVGDSDYNYIAGKLRIGSTFPTRGNGGDGDKGLEVFTDARFNATNYYKAVATITSTNAVSVASPGLLNFRLTDSTSTMAFGPPFGYGASLGLFGKNENTAVRGGVDINIPYGGNATFVGENLTAGMRLVFYDNNQVLERRYLLQRRKAYIEVLDSFSFQAPAYKFAGIPAGAGTKALRYNASTGYLSYADTSSGSGTNIYNTDGSLTGNRVLSLAGSTLHMANGSLFGSTELYLDPTANNEQVFLEAFNTTGGDNVASYYGNTTASISQVAIQSKFNGGLKSSIIELDAAVGAGTMSLTATDAISIIGGTMDIRSTTSTLTLRTSVRAVDITDSIYAYPLPRTNDTTTYKIVGRSNHGGLVDMNWSNSSAAVTWNAITNPTGTQTLAWDDAELNAWTNGSNTETFLTVNNNSLTTGIGELWQSSSLTTGTLSSLISTSTALAAGNELLNLSMSGANGTNAITATPLRISVTNTNATSGTNVGLDITASGATTDNIGVQSLANKNIFTPSTDNSNTIQIKDAGGTVRWQAGTFFGATTYGALYPSGTPSGVNYVLGFNNSQTLINAPVDLYLRVNNVTLINIFSTGVAIGNGTTQATARLHIGAQTTAASTAPIKLITGTVMTTAEAGAIEYTTPQLFFTNGGAQRQEIQQVQQSRVSTQFDKTNETLGNITGLTATLVASGTYRFEGTLYTTSDVTGGIKCAVAGTCTATAITYEVLIEDAGLTTQGRQTALAGSTGVTAVTASLVKIYGTITVANAGTLTLQSARNSAAGTTSILVGSTFIVNQIL